MPVGPAAGLLERAQERELGALEHVLRRLRRVDADDVAVHPHAGEPLAQLGEDVLGHDELAHALVAADAGVQVAQAHGAAHAEHLGDPRRHGVLGDGRQVEPARPSLQPREVGGLRDDGGDDVVVDPDGEVRGHAAVTSPTRAAPARAHDGARRVDHGRDDGHGVAGGVRRVGEHYAHVLDGLEREGAVAAEDGGGREQARRIERPRRDVFVGEAPGGSLAVVGAACAASTSARSRAGRAGAAVRAAARRAARTAGAPARA